MPTKMLTQWMQPIAEKEYIRVLYLGKLQLRGKREDGKPSAGAKEIALKEMISDIWKVARKFNSSNFISGHLSFTKSLYVVQLLEGLVDHVSPLMERIKKDPRVVIEKVFTRKIQTMNVGWELSMSYSFNLTQEDMAMIKNPHLSLDELFENITNTYEVKRMGVTLPKFYRNTVDIMLLKYISLDRQTLLNIESILKF